MVTFSPCYLAGLQIAEYFKIKNVDYEVRAGLSSVYNVAGKGWVADDIHSESASRTLDYACKVFPFLD